MNYGYVRVSAKDQNEDRQVIALKGAGISEENIFIDKCSGKNFDRPEFTRMIPRLQAGDALFVKSIDRLGRNYEDITTWWRRITHFRGADIVVLDMPLLDTRPKKNDLTSRFVADLVLQILSYVAETERVNIRQRQAEGIAAAKAKGVRFGREAKPLPPEFDSVYKLWRSGSITGAKASEILQMPTTTFARKAKKYSEEVG